MLVAKKTKKTDFDKVVEMLQDISDFMPNKFNSDEIWNQFSGQNNVFAYSFFNEEKLVGYGSFIIETKIRGGKVAHIEDIVVDDAHRGKGFGSIIMNFLNTKAKENKCYKSSLSCKNHNISFYENCGFKKSGNTMNFFRVIRNCESIGFDYIVFNFN